MLMGPRECSTGKLLHVVGCESADIICQLKAVENASFVRRIFGEEKGAIDTSWGSVNGAQERNGQSSAARTIKVKLFGDNCPAEADGFADAPSLATVPPLLLAK